MQLPFSQTATAIEILDVRPIRMRDLINLDLEKHLRSRRWNGGMRHIVFEGDETKNYEPKEFPLPPTTVATINEKYRPILVAGQARRSFPGHPRGTKHPNTLAEQVKRAVWNHSGLAWNPH